MPLDAPRIGALACTLQIALQALYAAVTLVGLVTLPAPEAPIADPWFTAMELLILAMIPVLVTLFAALHEAAPPRARTAALAAFGFALALVVVTGLVHFSVLTLRHQPDFAEAGPLLGFRWPSLVYAADILAWDVFFPLAALATAAALPGPGKARAARALLIASAVLAFAGLSGLPAGDMRLRNIGILGYAVLFPLALVPLAGLLRERAHESA